MNSFSQTVYAVVIECKAMKREGLACGKPRGSMHGHRPMRLGWAEIIGGLDAITLVFFAANDDLLIDVAVSGPDGP